MWAQHLEIKLFTYWCARRDVSRLAVKAKEARVAALEYEVAVLRTEKKADIGTIRNLKRRLAADDDPP